ncbi:uncharacterized protein LOC130735212 [Lotus japonicus]|uniref:uncharacterized protein LOC130735212 n=1 Tax=Lotus japonicus TaxID=34305 RepID=UPI002590D77F|nr:uncharacterized protein LOC130735212 [Lotus japonicus]
MSFGLKNAGATYQRLMDRVFEKQVGRNMEIYVDDMVVKSEEMGGHCMDLAEAFGEIRKHNMRLNPEKCSFGIQSGKFLGFMITRRGIEVNPDKCKAILDMQSPTSVKEVQKLTGRIAALSRFLPCSGSKEAPFLKCLRKNKAFQWTDECEQAFQTLKEHLAKPPILSKPIPGIPLSIFISISDNVVSSVLLEECKEELRIIYFVSHALQGAESRYQKKEKAALALIITARKLSPYFQEFGIVFEKKGQIKAQGLIDFVNEMSPEERVSEEVEWFLSVDGSSNLKGSGAGIVLEGPGGVIIEQSLKFDFKASNNQAEYEAIIAGVRLALEMNVRCIVIKIDSQLVANQIKGDYQAKDVQLAKYLVKVQELLKQMDKFQVNHVPREENTRADILSKLASTKKPGNNKSVIQETLKGPSVKEDDVVMATGGATLDWMDRIRMCLEANGSDLALFSKDQIREASRYTMMGGQLYKRGVGVPLLRCVSKEDAERIMFEFTSRKVRDFCAEMGIENRFASVEHPQSNGQVEAANKVILNGVKKRLGEAKGLWADELITVVWAYNTTPQSTTGETPFKLAYGVDAMIPVEIQDMTFRVAAYEENQNRENVLVDLNLADEIKAEVRLREAVVKQRSERRYNTRVVPRSMKVGDLVLRTKAKSSTDSKLTPNWEGPYRVLRDLGQGAYHLEELSGRRVPRAWNAQHLRYYYS